MKGDCVNYAKRCHKCPIYGDKIYVPHSPLHMITSPWPFSIWGGHGCHWANLAKGFQWVSIHLHEAASYANVTKSTVSKFLKNKKAKVYSQFKIKHHNSSPYHLKMNGAVEAANKNIKKIVGKMTETYNGWHEKLSFALYAYRASVKTSTGTAPSHWFMEWRQSCLLKLRFLLSEFY
ncbi:RNA-directed DNA polymerase [Gossypium australe]|uniref:RNA-directed DNA polymerase n=1 Tax=Gossypium australe TaxID=47621 RepID=A0A5B6VNC0_9ROSI|nr:RNA-directed DNA polymerase [Gossypium australe]